MNSLLASLDSLNFYLRGGQTKSLKAFMRYYDNQKKILEKDFFGTKITSHTELILRIESILLSLNIPKSELDQFNQNLFVYDFLIQLAKKGYSQIDYVLYLLDKKFRLSNLELFFRSSVIIVFIWTLMLTPPFYLIAEFIKTLLSSAIGFPLFGLIFNCAFTCYTFYYMYTDRKKNLLHRSLDIAFLFASSTLNITAYFLLITASAAMSPLTGGFFVAASAIAVLKDLFCLIYELQLHESTLKLHSTQHVAKQCSQARYDYSSLKRKNAIAINLTAALLLLAIMTVWCFTPGALTVTIVAMAAMSVVFALKNIAFKLNEYYVREQLQNRLHGIEAQGLSSSNTPGFKMQSLPTATQDSTQTSRVEKKHVVSVNLPSFFLPKKTNLTQADKQNQEDSANSVSPTCPPSPSN